MSYPKWVQRAPHIGAVLCQTAEEETKLLADYDRECKSAAAKEKATAKAEKDAADAEALARAEEIRRAQEAEAKGSGKTK